MGKANLAKISNRFDLGDSPLPVRTRRLSQIITRQAAIKRRSSEISSPSVFDTFHPRKRSKRAPTIKCRESKSKKELDTNIFESFLENLWRNISEDKRSSCTYLDCLWFSLYKEGSAATKVLTWIKRKHIFSRKYVFVPIICWKHWSLLILCHFGARTPCMLLLDSLIAMDPMRLEPDIRKFVLDVYRSEGRKVKKEFVSRIPLLVPKVPQQRNAEDCGIFVLHFINLFLQSAPDNFSISKGYPYFLKENWFDNKCLQSFSEELRSFSLKKGYVR